MKHGELAERLMAPVSKTGDPSGSGGSNPSLSAMEKPMHNKDASWWDFIFNALIEFCDFEYRHGMPGNPALVSMPWSGALA